MVFREGNYDISTTGLNNCRMRRVSRVLSNMCLPSDYKGSQHQGSSTNKMQSSKNANQSGHGAEQNLTLAKGQQELAPTNSLPGPQPTISSPQVDLQRKYSGR